MQLARLSARFQRLPWGDVKTPALVLLWLGGAAFAAHVVMLYWSQGWLGADAHAYWATGQPGPLYDAEPGIVDAFLYSPAFAQLIRPLTLLPWPIFFGVWVILEVGVFLWLFRPLGWRWAIPLTLCCAAEWTVGNVVPFLAASAVLGMRRPGFWACVAFTKPTMTLGPVWFAARRDWASTIRFVLVSSACLALSVALSPSDWADWIAFLVDSGGAQASSRLLVPRVLGAVLLTIIAARSGWLWPVAVAMLIATPVYSGSSSLTVLAAIPRLVLLRRVSTPAPIS